MSDFDDLVAEVEGSEAPAIEVPLLFDPAVIAKHRELEDRLQRAVSQPSSGIGEDSAGVIAQQIQELVEASDPKIFRFVPVSPKRWSDLQAEAPPKKGEGGHINPDKFWPKAMAECCETPGGATEESFRKLRDSGKLTNGQWQRLINGCREANESVHSVDPSRLASGLLRRLGQNLTTADPEESPGPSSSDG